MFSLRHNGKVLKLWDDFLLTSYGGLPFGLNNGFGNFGMFWKFWKRSLGMKRHDRNSDCAGALLFSDDAMTQWVLKT